MFWYQLLSKLRHAVEEYPRNSPRDTDTIVHEATGPVFYTIEETLRDKGSYTVDSSFNIKGKPVSLCLYFVRAEDQPTLPVQPFSVTEDDSRGFSLKLVQQWLSACHSSHPQCKLNSGSQARKFFRILKVGMAADFGDLRLCDAGEVSSETHYMTLIHCWGGLKIMTLTMANYQALKRRVHFDGLPKTFQNAITVTRSLGIQFLWIDSLCIIQDNEEDWRLQAKDMGEIYHHSWCNIAATAARDGREGLFQYSNRNPAYLKRFKVCVADFEQLKDEDIDEDHLRHTFYPNDQVVWRGMAPGYYNCVDRELWLREVSQSPLGRRAWVVQERLLAPRVVHFGANELFWECNSLKAREIVGSVQCRLLCHLVFRGDPRSSSEFYRTLQV